MMPPDTAATVARTPAENAVPVPRQRQARSKATNRGGFLREDRRTTEWRRLNDLTAELSVPFGPAGPSEAQRRVIKRLAVLTVTLEQLGGRATKGEVVNPDDLVRLSRAIDVLERRLTEAAPKKAEPTGAAALAAHLARRAAERAAGDADAEVEEAVE